MAESAEYNQLLKRLEKTERNAQIARDWVEIANLHGRYNHLCLGHYWDKIVDELFAKKTPGVKCEIVESGVFHGLDGVRKVFVDMLGKLYNYEGNCAIHQITTPVIQVQKDMKTAKGMWFHMGFNTFFDPEKGVIPIWQSIKYNHIFVKEGGLWKFWDYRAHLLIRSSYEKAWVEEPVIQGSTIKGTVEVEAPKPDEPTSFHEPYPGKKGSWRGFPLPPEYVDLDNL